MTCSPAVRPPGPATLIRLTVYSCAALMDVVLSSVLFACSVRAAGMGASAGEVGLLLSVWSVVYMVVSPAIGRVVDRRNVAVILMASCVMALLLSICFVTWPGLRPMYAFVALTGVACAFFFTPFQVFMKLVDEGQNKGVARSSGLYVFSWSTGFALGPFISGLLWSRGWWWCHVFNGVAALAMAVVIYLLKHHADASPVIPQDAAEGAAPASPSAAAPLLDLAWMAWVFGGIGSTVVSVIRGVFPSTSRSLGLPEADQGMVFFILSAVQALTGFFLGYGRRWMYRALPLAGFGLLGAAGLFLFAAGDSTLTFSLAAMLYGCYSGSLYFYFAYHSLIHPTRSGRYVSINEAVVGIAGVIGPLAGGYLADWQGLRMPYSASAVMLLGAVAVQAVLHHGSCRRAERPVIGPG